MVLLRQIKLKGQSLKPKTSDTQDGSGNVRRSSKPQEDTTAVKRNKISRTARERAVSMESDDSAPGGPADQTKDTNNDDTFDGPAPPTHGRHRTKTMTFTKGSVLNKPAGMANLQIDDSNDVDEDEPQDRNFKSTKVTRVGPTTTPRATNLPSARAGRNPLAQSAHQGTPSVKSGSSKISSVNALSKSQRTAPKMHD